MAASAPQTPCAGCGAPMDPSRAIYDKNGNLVCPACAARVQIAEGDARAVKSITGAAFGVLVGGLFSVTCFNPAMIVSIVTLVSGVGWLLMVARNAPLREKMGGKFVISLVAVIVGLLLGAVVPLLVLLGISLAAARH